MPGIRRAASSFDAFPERRVKELREGASVHLAERTNKKPPVGSWLMQNAGNPTHKELLTRATHKELPGFSMALEKWGH